MAKLAALLRVQALGAFGLNAAIRSTDVRRRMTLTGMALLFVLVGVVMAVYCYATGAAMASVGAASSVPSFAVFAGSCAAAAASLLKAGGALFGFKDYDTVMALPVPTWQVVLSRLASLYAMAALLCAVLMVPLYVASLPAAGVGVAGWLAALLSMVLVPAIPLAVAVAVAFLVSLVASRMRHAQAVAGIAGLALVVALVVAMGGLSQPSPALGGDAQAALGQAVASFAAFASGLWLPAGWVQAAVIQGQPLALALFAAASVACAVLCVAVVSRFFERLNAAVSSPALARSRQTTFGRRSRGPVRALVEKELRLVLSTPIYLMNMGIGPVLGFAVGCACFVAGPSLLSTVAESLPAGAGTLGSVTLEGLAAAGLPWVFAFCAATGVTSSCSVSLEGSARWIMETVPQPTSVVLGSKVLANLLFAGAPILTGAALAAVGLHVPPVSAAMFLLVPAAVTCFSACLGAFLNARMPNYSWKSAYEVVKRSVPVMAALLGGIVLSIAGLAASCACTVLAGGAVDAALVSAAVSAVALAAAAAIARTAFRMPLGD